MVNKSSQKPMRASQKSKPNKYGSNLKLNRRALMAKIHIAKKQLNLSDENYRSLLRQTVEKTSCADMSDQQLTKVLTVLKEYGFKPRPKKSKPTSHQTQIRAIFGLWWELCDAGVFHTKTRDACTVWVHKQTGVDDPNWLSQPQAVDLTNQLRKIIRDTNNGIR